MGACSKVFELLWKTQTMEELNLLHATHTFELVWGEWTQGREKQRVWQIEKKEKNNIIQNYKNICGDHGCSLIQWQGWGNED